MKTLQIVREVFANINEIITSLGFDPADVTIINGSAFPDDTIRKSFMGDIISDELRAEIISSGLVKGFVENQKVYLVDNPFTPDELKQIDDVITDDNIDDVRMMVQHTVAALLVHEFKHLEQAIDNRFQTYYDIVKLETEAYMASVEWAVSNSTFPIIYAMSTMTETYLTHLVDGVNMLNIDMSTFDVDISIMSELADEERTRVLPRLREVCIARERA